MRRMRKIALWCGLGLGLVGVVAIALMLAFPIQLAQWALDRLAPHGLNARVHKANLLSGQLQVKDLVLLRRKRGVEFQLHAQTGQVTIKVWRIIMGSRKVAALSVKGPSIRIRRGITANQTGQTPGHAPKRIKLRERLRKMRQFLRSSKGRLLRIGVLEIIAGKAAFLDRSQANRLLRVKIGQLDASLQEFKGRIAIQGIQVALENPYQRLQIVVPKAQMDFHLDHFMGKQATIQKILLTRPDWKITLRKRRKRRPPTPPKAEVQAHVTLLAPQLRVLQIVEGKFQLEDRSRKGKHLQVKVTAFDAQLKDLRGKVKLRTLQLSSKAPKRTVTLLLPKGEAEIELSALIEGRIALEQVRLQKPIFSIESQGRRKPKKRKRRRPWLQVKQLVIADGQLTMKAKTRPNAAGQRRTIRLDLQTLHAEMQGLDLRYLLARPFRGKGSARIKGHGGIRFVAKPLTKGAHRFSLYGLPVTIANQAINTQKTPIQLTHGRAHGDLDFAPANDEKVRVTARVVITKLRAVVTPGRGGLKKLALRLGVKLLNGYFQKRPQGYRVTAHFRISQAALADAPPLLIRRLQRHLRAAMLDAIFAKHPTLARLRPMIERRLKKRKANAAKRAQRQQRRADRKEKRLQRRAARKEKRLQRRQQRRERLRKFRKRW